MGLTRPVVAWATACGAVLAVAGPPTAHARERDANDLVLVRQDFDVLEAPLTAKLAIDPVLPPGTDPTSVTVVVTAYERVADPSAFDAVAGGRLGNALDSVDLPLPELTDDGSRLITVPLEISVDAPGALQLRRPGLYPIVFDVRLDGDSVADLQTFVNRLPEQSDTAENGTIMQLSMLAAIESRPALGPQGVDVDPAVLDELERLAALLQATGSPLTVSLPPEVLVALSDTDPELLERLAEGLAGDEVLSTPYVPFDPSSAVKVESDTIDGPKVFTDLLRQGEEAVRETVGAASVRTAWVSGGAAISRDGAAMLRDLGVRLLVVTRGRYDETEGNIRGFTDPSLYAMTQLPDGSRLPTAVIDDGFSLRLVSEGVDVEQAAIAYVADLVAWQTWFAATDPPGRTHTMTLALPDLGVPDATFAARILELARATPNLQPVHLSTALATTSPMGTGTPEPVLLQMPSESGPDVSARMQQVSDVALKAISTGSMLQPDDPRPQAWGRLIELLPSTLLDGDTADSTVEHLEAAFAEIQSVVQPPQEFSFTLSGDHSTVPLRFVNTGDEPVRIMLRLTSPKLEFPDNDRIEILEPGVNEVSVEVDALSNGKAPVTLEVLTPTGARLVEPIPLAVSVTALTGLAQVVTLGALGLLATWWLHHLRAVRRRRGNGKTKHRHPAAGDSALSGSETPAPAAGSLPHP